VEVNKKQANGVDENEEFKQGFKVKALPSKKAIRGRSAA
jgi:hypothetical protein